MSHLPTRWGYRNNYNNGTVDNGTVNSNNSSKKASPADEVGVPPEHVLEREHLEPNPLDLLHPLDPPHHHLLPVEFPQPGHLPLGPLLQQGAPHGIGIDSGVSIGQNGRLAAVNDLHQARLPESKHKEEERKVENTQI